MRSALLFFLLAAVCAALFIWIVPQHYFSLIPFLFFYFYLLTNAVFFLLLRAQNLPIIKFNQRFLILTSIKFFGSIIFVAVFLMLAPQHAVAFVMIYITLYFVSLIHEVSSYLRFLKRGAG